MEFTDNLLDRDLSIVHLTGSMKQQLVEEACKPGSSFGIVAKRTNLRRDRVLSFRKKLLKGKSLFENGGRPAKLDDVAIETLVAEIRQTPDMSKSQLYKLIRIETQNTFTRRYPGHPINTEQVKIARLSLIRWVKKLFSIAQEQEFFTFHL